MAYDAQAALDAFKQSQQGADVKAPLNDGSRTRQQAGTGAIIPNSPEESFLNGFASTYMGGVFKPVATEGMKMLSDAKNSKSGSGESQGNNFTATPVDAKSAKPVTPGMNTSAGYNQSLGQQSSAGFGAALGEGYKQMSGTKTKANPDAANSGQAGAGFLKSIFG